MNEIPPPKPKKPQGVKRKKGLQEDLEKARRATRLSIKKQEAKIEKTHAKYKLAKSSAESKKKSLKEACQ